METLVPCGFLVGTHSGHLWHDEAKEELQVSLGLEDLDLPFQLSLRSILVAIADGKPGRFNFQAIVVETSTIHASKL